jgi:hypothetical protein
MTTTINRLKELMDTGLPWPPLSSPPIITRPDLAALLREGTYRVKFTKVDGSVTEMTCTLDPRLLPPGDTTSVATSKPDLIRVYSTDRQGWRSIRLPFIHSITKDPS